MGRKENNMRYILENSREKGSNMKRNQKEIEYAALELMGKKNKIMKDVSKCKWAEEVT